MMEIYNFLSFVVSTPHARIFHDDHFGMFCQDESLDITGLSDDLQSVSESWIQRSILQQGVL